MTSLTLDFIIVGFLTDQESNERQNSGRYHYPKLESAINIKNALESSVGKTEKSIDTERDTVGYSVTVSLNFNSQAALQEELKTTVNEIATTVQNAQATFQPIDIHVKDVDCMDLKNKHSVPHPPRAFINRQGNGSCELLA